MRAFLAAALRHRTSALGVALTAASSVVFLALVGLELVGLFQSPYSGIVVFVMLPIMIVVGLLLIPVGMWGARRKEPMKAADTRPALLFVGGATIAYIALLSFASYGAVEYSESGQFCGQSCHVMEPQFLAHRSGLHGRVTCVACHVEPGAHGFFKAKLNGTRQLALVMTGGYPKPIPSPPQIGAPNVHTSCEQCHWPDRFIGDVIKVVHEYADDEPNTETKTTLRMHVGGPISGTSSGVGIHWHMNRSNKVEYVALDPTLEQIPYVRVSTPDGGVREYVAEGSSARDFTGKPVRHMVCTDCHNRPAHRFGTTAERSVDAALGAGQMSVRLPFVRREAVRALKVAYPTQTAAVDGIGNTMRAALQPRAGRESADALQQAIAVTQNIYRTSVFPEMKIDWGTYNYQIGHVTTPGCFRCHDGTHTSREGKVIGQDCESCHSIE